MNEMSAGKIVDVLVVGSGFGGLAAAIRLREAGFDDVLIIEKGDDVGGTWRENTYPGCACDIPSHLYSLSFAQNRDWSRLYPRQPELFAYLKDVAARFGLHEKIRLNTAMLSAAWDEGAMAWRVQTTSGRITARVLISGIGGLHIPAEPALPGLAAFEGIKFHSARWDHKVDLKGKNVAVVGTGASAIQFVPEIAPVAGQLTVYQRTAPWVMPKPDRAITGFERAVLKIPAYRALFRKYLFWTHELRVLAFLGNKRAQKLAEHMAQKHLAAQVPDPSLRAKLTPDYRMGCKRVMIANDYYPALTRPNVELVTDRIAEVRAHSIVDAAGAERPVDVMIFGTGFEVTTAYKHWDITGTGGRGLREMWDATGMQAFNGVAVAGFPNFFMLLGPNTALGHNSVVLMIEAQVGYIVDLLTQLRGRAVRAAEVQPAAQAKFVQAMETRLAGTVWQDGGCQSWYKDAHGRVSTIWPGSAAAYQKAMRQADLRDYKLLTSEAAITAL